MSLPESSFWSARSQYSWPASRKPQQKSKLPPPAAQRVVVGRAIVDGALVEAVDAVVAVVAVKLVLVAVYVHVQSIILKAGANFQTLG